MIKFFRKVLGIELLEHRLLEEVKTQFERERRLAVDVAKLKEIGTLAEVGHLKEAVDAICERLHCLSEYENTHIAKIKELDYRLDQVKNNCAIVQVNHVAPAIPENKGD